MRTKVVFALIFFFSPALGAPSPLIDLGYEFNENTQFWPGVQRFNVTSEIQLRDENGIPWYAANSFETAEHLGTHLDAPFHFNENGWKVAEIPLERLIAPGVLIDVSELVQSNGNFELRRDHIESWEEQNGPLPDRCIVLIRFGWSSAYYSNRTAYFGFGRSNLSNLSFPGISNEAAAYIVETGNVYGVGVDTASLDPGKNVVFNAHQTLLGANIYGLENLNIGKEVLPASGFLLHVMPMKITKGTGAPSRVIAVNKKEWNL